MAAILAQNPLVTFCLPCGKVSRDFPLNMAKIGIASAKRDQSPIRSRCSHWRNSPLKPMLSAIWKLAMTQRSICLPDFRRFRRFAGIRGCFRQLAQRQTYLFFLPSARATFS